MKAAILGGGAAGIITALELNRKSRIKTFLFDLNPQPGRKLAVTGSGRGNLTNEVQDYRRYGSSAGFQLDRNVPLPDPELIRARLHEYGIPTVATDDGWVYPISNSAANAVSTLRAQLSANQVEIVSETKITRLSVNRNAAFGLTAEDGRRFSGFDALVVATGSPAYPQIGGDDSILSEIRALGVRAHDFSPALTGIILKNAEKRLSGTRLDVRASLTIGGKRIASESGNLIFTDFGVNGPAAMNLSHLAARAIAAQAKTDFSIDLLIGNHAKMLCELFYNPAFNHMPYAAIFHAVLPEKVGAFFLNRWGIPPGAAVGQIEPAQFKAHLKSLTALRFSVAGTKSFRDAQVGYGGVDLNEVDFATMESKKIPGLYFAGEILDVVGKCGGYNLSWAFSSGIRAGNAVAERLSAG